MKNRNFIYPVIAFNTFMVTSCGNSKGDFKDTNNPPAAGSNPSIDPAESTWNSLAVTSVALLPKCDSSKTGALAYVRGEKKFYSCDGNTWQPEDIIPKDSFAVIEKWKFHVDSYQGEPNLSDEAADLIVNIGDIEIIKYANGTASYVISGASVDKMIIKGDDAFSENFSYSGTITDLSKEYSKILKFHVYLNSRLRIRINFSGPSPRFEAVVDIDGNFSDNIDKIFPLTKDTL